MGSFGGEGRLIGGRYRLGVRLGRGGMGTVWRATDELLARQVAVKELHLDEEAGEGEGEAAAGSEPRVQRERAMREARTVAGIKHPNVIVVHDVVEQDGRPWIVMELVEGASLADRLRSGGPVAPREAARIGVALLGALRAAHTRGVLHRDLKPANVLMEAGTGRVVLTDFGIAQVPGVTTLTDPGGFVGSPEYTAPERMSGRGTGPEADLWSLGVLLCAALSGASPFHRDSLGGVLHAVVYEDIEFPEAARALRAVVEGLLERDPERRLGVAETERLLRGYLRSGRSPERGADDQGLGRGHGHGHGHGRGHGHGGDYAGDGGDGAAGRAAEAVAGASGLPGRVPAGPGSPHGPHHPGPDVHACPHDGPGDGLPSEHPPSEDPLAAGAPSVPPPGPGRAATGGGDGGRDGGRDSGSDGGEAEDAGQPGGHAGGRSGGRAPGAPVRASLDDRALAVAARPHTGRLRTALLVALAAVVIGGAGAGLAVLLMHPDGTHPNGSGSKPGGRSPQASESEGGPGPARTPGPVSGQPTVTVTVTSSPSPGATGTVPAGYRLVHDPAGFVLAVPDGFTRSYENGRVYYSSQGRRFRIGIQLQKRVPEGPLGAMRAADAEGPAHYRGYRQGQVTETTHNGLRAGRWEFVWDGGAQDGGPRCTYDLSWDEGGRMIDVWISSPVGARTEATRHFDTALDAFRLTGA
ncbi:MULTISPECIES: serine/threonine-protein kinase [unclassified Streptomyces]|uniref:serine/threonine-protein kinase n=1 Tax=unclassified Streptomyces TaxID=2593676 RepID=UPI00088DDCF6|nr:MULTISPECIES: serine/threonine-protein kinase [unclassified Streptomyces]PBC84473.1 serine/threonine protein kinase [Streptomyces sp. 2321.6]SDR30302.1 Serine/threonine protein kinase [Streptomyces sp. KS_16]SED32662.1 Serine/threonine protein kinase [Streptomyces sp. 2133.1]SNC70556.1 Serine/threonine protein kinase [Streptomyces sp. 2114.4]